MKEKERKAIYQVTQTLNVGKNQDHVQYGPGLFLFRFEVCISARKI
jgi:hypothetical protein